MHTGLRPPSSYRPLPHCLAWASRRLTQGYTGGERKGPNGGGSSPAWALAGGQRRHLVLSESPGGSTAAGGAVPPSLRAGSSANGRLAGERRACHEVIGGTWGRAGGVARRRAGRELAKALQQWAGRGAANGGAAVLGPGPGRRSAGAGAAGTAGAAGWRPLAAAESSSQCKETHFIKTKNKFQ